jgi:hypothetical protein
VAGGGSTSPSRRRLFVLVGAAIGLGAIWFLWPGRPHEEAASPPAANEPAARVATAPSPPPRRTPAPPPSEPYKEEVVTSDGLPIVPAHEGDPRPDGPMHPHPITPQHVRLYAENHLVGVLNGAMEVKDVPAMRRFLEQYRREYPEDDNDLQDGYAVIADCLEHPGAATRQAAERWLPLHNGSILKRFVNRHCLEPQQ